MKINTQEIVNGEVVTVTRDMTPEEEAELLARQQSAPVHEPTAEERIAELEQQLAAAKILLGVE